MWLPKWALKHNRQLRKAECAVLMRSKTFGRQELSEREVTDCKMAVK